MKVLIIEDEAPAYRRLNDLLISRHPDIEVVEVIDAVDEAVKWLRNHQFPDLIFSDIQLADGLSFEIYKQVEVKCPIIFTTAYDEYMLEAFQTNGIDYLLKPIEADRLSNSIDKFQRLRGSDLPHENHINELLALLEKQKKSYKQHYLIKLGNKLIPLNVDQIAYFKSSDGITQIISKEGKKYLWDQSLDELEEFLDPANFFRINRQIISSIQAIKSIHQYFKGKLKVMLSPVNDEDVIVSREKAKRFKEWFS